MFVMLQALAPKELYGVKVYPGGGRKMKEENHIAVH